MNAETSAQERDRCLLMFSGGRDSTLAAVRLAARGNPLTLVTVSASHLHGFDRVQARYLELASKLPAGTRWLRIQQPKTGDLFGKTLGKTCLPCQHDYALAGALIAKQQGTSRLAFGYATYQNTWPEQHPLATAVLTTVLAEFGMLLELPVYDLASREEAIASLVEEGLDHRALEQKCSKQVFNLPLPEHALQAHLERWGSELKRSLAKGIEVEVLDEGVLGFGECAA